MAKNVIQNYIDSLTFTTYKNEKRTSRSIIQDYLDNGNNIRSSLINQSDVIIAIANVIIHAFLNDRKVIILGNGGSAADAQHIAAEFISGCFAEGISLPALALTTNTSCLTSIANDYGYEYIFVRQLQALVRKSDVVIGISTSGNSVNVLRAMEAATKSGAITVSFTGEGGKLKQAASYVISIPSNDTPLIQEAHITVGHLICFLVGDAFIKRKPVVAV
jgi:D-sedoheptulose 7-phosphate isomerase